MSWKHRCWRVFCLTLPVLLDQALTRVESWVARKRGEDVPYWERW